MPYPLCHSERSGTTVQRRTLKSIIAAESNPEGAPAGGISALVQGILSNRPQPTNQARSRTLCRSRTSQSTQKLPCTATAVPKTREVFTHQPGGCRAGKFGEGQGGLEGRETPPKGVSLRLQGLPKSPRQPPLPWQGVRVLRGWKGFSDAERRGKARRRPS